ncbi:YggT family protein [Clostridium thailandense]|uniref:YggT family protein n=1 Tax=Clostridium thailandense TaxID=2794346 RepID=A0A949TMD3_9CLOT|nr:YggT family protein [Clostridium thailandense]MBV7275025.1 YggT family protein [Clostridium thailandense]MCH5136539.1 YggT family protein [Clostridiaceae bacterium UIB06]
MIYTLGVAFSLLFRIIEAAILVDVVLSWIMPGKRGGLIDLLHVFTDPFMMPGRKIQEKLMPGLMIDFSPIIALLILDILRKIVFTIL